MRLFRRNHPRLRDKAAWRRAVAKGETTLGYAQWRGCPPLREGYAIRDCQRLCPDLCENSQLLN